MIYFNTYLRDFIGNNYVGLKFPNTIINPFLNELRDMIGDSEYEKYTNNQKLRDHNEYHCTVINVMDFNRLAKESGMDKFIKSLDFVFKYEIDDLQILGLGTAERSNNRAYFIVCKSEKLDAVRERFGLKPFHFHITLGFSHKDVFGVTKNEVIKKESKFLKLLRNEFYKNDNWNFIKRIDNYDLDNSVEAVPIEISNSRMKFKVQDYYVDVNWIEDGQKFWITTKYPVQEDLPRLSETEISKFLNKN